ncbi:hypothetical protein PSC71_11635 [Devosia sp. J2-20]|uniref:hypothetical protein n=1 Tax=Devosia sp. J2-20 TaxID=3026161 RepID=UPI00249B08D9|nr:hypothetical protein [Devosia sp. J2-20]WDQ97902.1 hypothetical protein PSC71_11635 [Devosia sp. J2-20]
MTDQPHTIAPHMWEKLGPGDAEAAISAPSLTYWQDARRRLWANKPAVIALGFIIALILGAIFGPLFSPFSYFEQNLKLANIPPAFETYAIDDGQGAQPASSSTPPISTSMKSTPKAMFSASFAVAART